MRDSHISANELTHCTANKNSDQFYASLAIIVDGNSGGPNRSLFQIRCATGLPNHHIHTRRDHVVTDLEELGSRSTSCENSKTFTAIPICFYGPKSDKTVAEGNVVCSASICVFERLGQPLMSIVLIFGSFCNPSMLANFRFFERSRFSTD